LLGLGQRLKFTFKRLLGKHIGLRWLVKLSNLVNLESIWKACFEQEKMQISISDIIHNILPHMYTYIISKLQNLNF